VFLNYLPKRLEKMNLKNQQQIIAELIKTLNQNQSIFTLSTH